MRILRPLALAAVALCLTALPAAAQTAGPSPEVQALGVQVAHEMFSAMDVADLIRQGAMGNTGALEAFAKYRPEWKPLVVQSLEEAVVRDTPAMEALFGRYLAKSMSKDELAAALVVFRDPQARAVFGAYARHQTPQGDPSKPCSGECMKAIASPAGRGFMSKMPTAFGQEAQTDMIVLIVPDFFIIFGEKAKAAEARRAAGQP